LGVGIDAVALSDLEELILDSKRRNKIEEKIPR
jgi:hypothetical protein